MPGGQVGQGVGPCLDVVSTLTTNDLTSKLFVGYMQMIQFPARSHKAINTPITLNCVTPHRLHPLKFRPGRFKFPKRFVVLQRIFENNPPRVAVTEGDIRHGLHRILDEIGSFDFFDTHLPCQFKVVQGKGEFFEVFGI